ncbi:hypothetical protein GCM10009727_72030 [Actinomadura napierensis]|uniref:Transposase n=1 Tax=Actinomadura napierensis TaxID=267854 RepID=A0ABP5M6Q8_9ACTN
MAPNTTSGIGISARFAGSCACPKPERPPGDRNPPPVCLWYSATGADLADVDRWWGSYLRRFDLEHTFRLFEQTLGWTRGEKWLHLWVHPRLGAP